MVKHEFCGGGFYNPKSYATQHFYELMKASVEANKTSVNGNLESLIATNLGQMRIPFELAAYSLKVIGISAKDLHKLALERHITYWPKGRDGITSWVTLDPVFSPSRSSRLKRILGHEV